MSRIDDQLRERFQSSNQPDRHEDVHERIAGRQRAFAVRRRIASVALTCCVLLGTVGGYALLQRAFGADGTAPKPADTGPPPSYVAPELRLGFPTCRVTAMPITTTLGAGTAWVFTRAGDPDCPAAGDGISGVAVDVDGDRTADASSGPLEDCFLGCEVFAAPDVDGDGTSEVAVSTAGADGYGVWLYHVTSSPPAIVPVQVHNTLSDRPKEGPLQFAWAGPVAHREDAICQTGADGPLFVMRSTDVLETDATMRTTSLLVDGATATVLSTDERTIPLEEVPGPGNELCGGSLYGSAGASFGDVPGRDAQVLAGVPFAVCRPMSIPGDFGGGLDTVWVFEEENTPGSGCTGYEGFQYVGVGTSEGVSIMSDTIRDIGQDGTGLWPFATPDVDGDGSSEIAIGLGGSHADGNARIVLFDPQLEHGGGRIVQVGFDCGPACDPVPWINLGSLVDSREGAYCGSIAESSPQALIRWSTVGSRIEGTAWYLDGDTLVAGDQVFSRPDDGSYPGDGMDHLCGVAVTWPDDLASAGPSP